MSNLTIDGADWEGSGERPGLRRMVFAGTMVLLIAGPLLIGGAVGWMMTREAGPMLGDDGWLRSRTGMASARDGFPLISANELEAAGLTVEQASRILRR